MLPLQPLSLLKCRRYNLWTQEWMRPVFNINNFRENFLIRLNASSCVFTQTPPWIDGVHEVGRAHVL